MSLKKFAKNDKFISRLKTYPKIEFLITDRKVYFNKKGIVPGKNVANVGHLDVGYLSLGEENIDKPTGGLIYPYITKDSTLGAFKTVSTSDFNNFAYGDILSSSYPLGATISIDRHEANDSRTHIVALENIFNFYNCVSPHYAYDSNLGNKETQKLAIISVPSIFYGSSIQKGSVDLKFYISGTMIGRLQDNKKNGELVQTEPYGVPGSGSVGGVVLYSEGFMVLTGAWYITDENKDYYNGGGNPTDYPKWFYFGSTGSSGHNGNIPSSSFTMDFNGVNYINTLTTFCHAHRAECDQSSNPTWIEHGQNTNPTTSSYNFTERDNLKIKNITKSPFVGASGSFEKIVYINKIVLFDNNKKAIAMAKLAKPLRKRENDDITFKLKVDLL